MKKLLLTGGSGFLVSNMLPYITTLEKVLLARRGEVDYCCDLAKEIPTFKESFDVVFHAAGKAHSTPKTQQEKEMFYHVNVGGTRNLCKGLEVVGVPKLFVYVSSVAVYGCEEGELITEEHPLQGSTPYALSKIEAEDYLRRWCMDHDVRLIILRPSLIAGKDAPGNLGAMVRNIKKGTYVSVGNGQVCRSIALASDFGKILSVLEEKKEIEGVFNFCADKAPSFRELELTICKQLGKQASVFRLPLFVVKILGRIGDLFGPNFVITSTKANKMMVSLTFSNKKIKSVVGWKPTEILDNYVI